MTKPPRPDWKLYGGAILVSILFGVLFGLVKLGCNRQ
jgi:hypothetical protein